MPTAFTIKNVDYLLRKGRNRKKGMLPDSPFIFGDLKCEKTNYSCTRRVERKTDVFKQYENWKGNGTCASVVCLNMAISLVSKTPAYLIGLYSGGPNVALILMKIAN